MSASPWAAGAQMTREKSSLHGMYRMVWVLDTAGSWKAGCWASRRVLMGTWAVELEQRIYPRLKYLFTREARFKGCNVYDRV